MKNTVSLEVAQLLKENGWEQDAWKGKQYCVGYWEKEWDILCCMNCIEDFNDYDFINAPQLHEILDALPEDLCITKYSDGYHARYKKYVGTVINPTTQDSELPENPHDAAALLWIELKKNNFLPNKQ